jgi:hypothetical protein
MARDRRRSCRDALRALILLAERALAHVRGEGLLGALTGPVARNDVATLAAQLRALRAEGPAAAAAHRALSLRLIDRVVRPGRRSDARESGGSDAAPPAAHAASSAASEIRPMRLVTNFAVAAAVAAFRAGGPRREEKTDLKGDRQRAIAIQIFNPETPGR